MANTTPSTSFPIHPNLTIPSTTTPPHPPPGGKYYALHIRRGDFQYKDVKHSAEEILANLRFPNNTPVIPPGSFVYLSTDDPKGVEENRYQMTHIPSSTAVNTLS